MEKNTEKKKNSGIGSAIWILFALILLICFLVCQDKILTVLKRTDFFTQVFNVEPEFVKNHELPPESVSSEPFIEIVDTSIDEKEDVLIQEEEVFTKILEEKSIEEKSVEEKISVPEKVNLQEVEKKVSVPMMNQYLCFIVIDGDGSVIRKEVTRGVEKVDTPLTYAINALLAGPSLSELEKGYMSLIPTGTRLLSASVKEKVAFLNFSEEFLYNKYGVQGYLGQLMQLVYTATAFNTIDSVQFLIDGEKTEYLGSEGVWIGTPLNRTSFR
jgi:spore germination protein GerM